MKFKTVLKRAAALATAACLAAATSASACTGIMLKTADGAFVHGRTVEFGIFIESQARCTMLMV